jgi:hypothetical protein
MDLFPDIGFDAQAMLGMDLDQIILFDSEQSEHLQDTVSSSDCRINRHNES